MKKDSIFCNRVSTKCELGKFYCLLNSPTLVTKQFFNISNSRVVYIYIYKEGEI